jgi:NADPH-dependent glutamate synthase beta subunit-like oxidoreductase/NAD-dependent dihydropyrimidine dehydrogenase PreA subunit
VNKEALIIGSSEAGIQIAFDLAHSGIRVHLVESAPFLRFNSFCEYPRYQKNSQLLEIVKHPNVRIWTNTSIVEKEIKRGGNHVELCQQPRYIDLSKCTACGNCVEVCPVMAPGANHKAIFMDGQPGCMVIQKSGRPPCTSACPSGVHVQGYVALINQGRYQEAIDLIRDVLPFPSVCGRVCNHQCEAACSRGKVDDPINIMALKRFVADWEYKKYIEQSDGNGKSPEKISSKGPIKPLGKKVGIIGAGPAGLTAARDLIRLGYTVTVFDALPVAGGMMRVGIPPHRLPSEMLDWEIDQIVDEGVEIKLNTRVDNINGLFDEGFQAVLIASGAHLAKKLPIPNADHPDNWLSLQLLRRARLGEEGHEQDKVDLTGRQVIVLGGGNVALDSARVALRLGAEKVRMACLEPRGEMPGFAWEIEVAEEEGVEIYPGRTFKEIVVENDEIVGVRCVEIVFRGFKNGRPDFDEVPGTEHVLPADLVIWAIGQGSDLSFLPPDGSIKTREPAGIETDSEMMTSKLGVFVAGDVRRGVTFFVVDAIGEGHKAARSIDRYLRGEKGIHEPWQIPAVEFTGNEIQARFDTGGFSHEPRIPISEVPLKGRTEDFREVDLTFKETEALAEANRCMSCGPCSECMACVNVCEAGAIVHDQLETFSELDVGAIIYADEPSYLADIPFELREDFYQVTPTDTLYASAIAARLMVDLHAERKTIPRPPKLFQRTLAPRIGVIICQCGGEISQIVDTQIIREKVATWLDVVHTQELTFSCSPEAVAEIKEMVKAYDLNKVVIAGCTCCELDQVCFSCTYQRVRLKDNLGLFSSPECIAENISQSLLGVNPNPSFEFVNIRESCAWIHSNDPHLATEKATNLIAAAVANIRIPDINHHFEHIIERSVILLGGGKAANTCLAMLSELDVTVHRFESVPERVTRKCGHYVISQHDETIEASALILTPQDKKESRRLLATFNNEENAYRTHISLNGMETSQPGVFFCDPKIEAERMGEAATARVVAWLGHQEKTVKTTIAMVDPARCRACGTCIDICEYGAPELVITESKRFAWIDPVMCRGCGTCAAHCPSGAIIAGYCTNEEFTATLDAVLSGGGV